MADWRDTRLNHHKTMHIGKSKGNYIHSQQPSTLSEMYCGTFITATTDSSETPPGHASNDANWEYNIMFGGQAYR